MKYGQIKSYDLQSVWRIVVAVMVCQLAGSITGLLVAIHHYWFNNLWLGGAAGTLPGFALGVIWQHKSSETTSDWVGTACFLGILSVALTGMAFGVELPMIQREMRNLNTITQLQTEGIQKIDVYDSEGKGIIFATTDTELLSTFAQGVSDAAGHSPNHPRYSHSWYVVVTGVTKHEYELHLNPRFPECVIGYFVTKTGNSTMYSGTFESKGLRQWIETNLMKRNANN